MIGSVPYYILLLTCLCLIFLKKHTTKGLYIFITIVLCSVLIVFSGLRYKVGADYDSYVYWYRRLYNASYDISVEPGHYLIVQICKILNTSVQFHFLIYSFLTIAFITLFIEKCSINKELSWVLFICLGPFYISTFNGVRQWLAVSLFAYALIWVKKGSFFKYFIMILLATCFHYSSIFMLPVYFVLRWKRFDIYKAIILFSIILLLSAVGGVGFFLGLFGANEFSDSINSTGMDFTYLLFILVSIGCYFIFKLFKDENENNDFIYKNMNLLSGIMVVCAFLVSTISNIVFVRFNTFFFVGYLILVPYLLELFGKNKKTVEAAITCFAIIYFLIIVSNNQTIIPYGINYTLWR